MTDHPKSKSRLVLIIVLAISLLFNALALGAGLKLYQARQALMGNSASIALPRDLRRDLVQALTAHRADFAPALQLVQDARRDAVLTATAKPYDPAKAAAALDVLRSALGHLMTEAQPIILQELQRRQGR